MQVVQGGNGLNPASQQTQTEREGRGGEEKGQTSSPTQQWGSKWEQMMTQTLPTWVVWLFFFGQQSWAECWEHALVTCRQRCDVTWRDVSERASNHQLLARVGHVSVFGLCHSKMVIKFPERCQLAVLGGWSAALVAELKTDLKYPADKIAGNIRFDLSNAQLSDLCSLCSSVTLSLPEGRKKLKTSSLF